MSGDLPVILPRILIVSRRTVRKNKFVDFVGEYHLDLIVRYGAVPVIVPRVSKIGMLINNFEPIHGVLLCEGEDIDPSLYDADLSGFSQEELEEIKRSHASDTAIDREKDSIELRLSKICLKRNIPYLGICRGSQILNVACGGTLYQDIQKQTSSLTNKVVHIDYENYDGHRHVLMLVEDTPVHRWFKDSLGNEGMEISVNSYHHQGVKRLARRFVPMAYSPDGLIEGFYDPDAYNPGEGKFLVGLQFHPERMRNQETDEFDYPGCAAVYQEFVQAVIAYEKRLSGSRNVAKGLEFDWELKKKIKSGIFRSFSTGRERISVQDSELEAGDEFLEANTALSLQQENRLKQMGLTVRDARAYIYGSKTNDETEKVARSIIGKMSMEQLWDMVSLYQKMGQMCSEVLESKLQGLMNQI